MNVRRAFVTTATLLCAACSSATDSPESDVPIIITTDDGKADTVTPNEGPTLEPTDESCVEMLRPEIVATNDGRPLDTDATIDVGSTLFLKAHNAPDSRWTVLRESEPLMADEGEELALDVTQTGRFDVQLTATEERCQATEFFTFSAAMPSAADAPGVVVELYWQTPGDPDPTDTFTGDLDLHYRREGGEWNERPLDCFAENKSPDWGPAGRVGNPQLAASVVSPERVEHPAPEAAFYDVAIEYADDRGLGASEATLKIWFDGALMDERRLTVHPGEFRPVARIWGANGTVMEIPGESAF